MPRAGYDLTGAAPGSPASEAAARARQRSAPGNRTPRAATPVDSSRPDEADQETTPRASRIGAPAESARADSPTYPPMGFTLQDPRGFQIQRRQPRQELYQNPLNIMSLQAAGYSETRPIDARYSRGIPQGAQSSMFARVAAPTSTTAQDIGFANAPTSFRPQQQQQQQQQQRVWNNSPFHTLPAGIFPDPEPFVRRQATAGGARAGTLASQAADEDVEMTGVDS